MVCIGKEAFRVGVVSKLIDKLNGRYRLGGFNQNQMREILQGVLDEIFNDVGI